MAEESYNVAVKVYSLYGAFFKEVAKELGELIQLANNLFPLRWGNSFNLDLISSIVR